MEDHYVGQPCTNPGCEAYRIVVFQTEDNAIFNRRSVESVFMHGLSHGVVGLLNVIEGKWSVQECINGGEHNTHTEKFRILP